MAVAKEDTRLKQLPEWIDRATCGLQPIYGVRPGMRLYFYCDCTLDKQVRVSANEPKAGWDDSKIATMLCDAVLRSKHPHCADRGTATAAAPTPREQQLEGALKISKRKLVKAASANELLQVQVNNGAAQKKACTENAKQKSLAAQRRVDIDPANKEGFTAANKYTAMAADQTGIMATVKYWAQGSMEKVFQLLMSLMLAFGLRERVAAELKVELDKTNAQVTSSINGAVQILKGCECEEQRQQYRIVMTAAAPPLVKKGDSSGLQSEVADAIGVNRKSIPYMECVQKRNKINAAAAAQKKPITVGDTVCCKHGTGTLVEYGGPDKPCAVKICVDGSEHISHFDHAKKSTKKCTGGGSIRHAPISFAHDGRKARKDRLPDYVKKQVPFNLCCVDRNHSICRWTTTINPTAQRVPVQNI